MGVEYLGRHEEGIYEFVCDADGCNNTYEHRINGDNWNGWEKLVVHKDGDHVVTKFLCPKHHIV